MRLHAVILAAGQGKRMKSKLYKVLHPVCGKPMVTHIADALERIQASRIIAVVGHGAEAVRQELGNRVEYALQEEQLGTGHAVRQAAPLLAREEGVTLVVCGDTPLLTDETLFSLLETHRRSQAAATLLTAIVDDASGYGRVVRGGDGAVRSIVEQKDCTEEQQRIREFNSGTYCFDNRKLFQALEQVGNDNAQGEYYLTDVIGILRAAGERVEGCVMHDPSEAAGVNDRAALSEVEAHMRRRINRAHMLAGVTLIDPDSTYIDAGVEIGADTVIYPGTVIRGSSSVGADCVIGPHAEIVDSVLGDGVKVTHSSILQAEAGDDCTIGPFAYLRPGAKLAARVKIGDFVEIKNAQIGEGSKVPHLSYVGDAVVGRNVNIGCGAITANYDGANKHVTHIDDGAFIGSNSNLIAPVKVGKDAYIVAGSTITQDVGDNEMAIARARQTNKPEYASRLRAKINKK